MDYEIESFRNAEVIFENDDKYFNLWQDVKNVLNEISDEDIIKSFKNSTRKSKKSISDDLNKLIDKGLLKKGWNRQSPIFKEHTDYGNSNNKDNPWTLDFSKDEISIEVAFNHGSVVAWNLIKPVLASELNHVEKAIQTSAGIIITVNNDMKKMGNFSDAIASFEKFKQYLKPLNNILTVPMIIIGIKPPKTFFINKKTKTVLDINDFPYKAKDVRHNIEKLLDEYEIEYKKNTYIQREGERINAYLKSDEIKLWLLKDKINKRKKSILDNEGWTVISTSDTLKKGEMDKLNIYLRETLIKKQIDK